MNLLFKNIRVINPAQELDAKVNLLIKDGVIAHCSTEEVAVDGNCKVVDGENLVCSPGLFDMHVHLREPGEEYKEDLKTGTDAAANGGFTGVVCMPNTLPAIDDVTVVAYIKEKTKDTLTEVFPAAAITQKREGKLISPMLELNEAGALYFTDDGGSIESAEMMKRAFDYAATKDLLIAQHCEEHSLTKNFAMNESVLSYKLGLKGYPNVAEDIIVSRDIMLAEAGNRKYHVSHISSASSVELVRKAKAKGARVTCEVTPHHFTLTEELLPAYDTNHKMNPPLRTGGDINAIIEGIKDGTIDCIATDHAPHALHEKEVEFERAPNGIVGLETALGLAMTNLVHAGHITLTKLIELMSVNPRKLVNLPEVKIAVGEAANLTIFAPNEDWNVNKNNFKTKSLNTPFDGMKLKGKPKFAINRRLVCESVL
eukprot:TRINITY_DN23483_c0_g1_i1.p1 TRINITY_DN23483_c0_g1~~TRINITY_DN23483_c0_g1_i1.p1  ORF type:complete len:427 (-),score=-31.83 TRINITY_DN23483_c0_g1_i1:626-1906(-)